MKRKRKDQPLWVEILEAKPNPLFTEDQRRAVRFLRYSRTVPCAECGKKVRIHWTLLVEFQCMDPNSFVIAQRSSKRHMPLTPVCKDHPLFVAESQS